MTNRPLVSVVIVSFEVRPLLRACLRSVQRAVDGLCAEVWVVDNASEDGSAEMVSDQFPSVKLLRNKSNRGFTAANNRALREVAGDCVLVLNPDTVVTDTTIVGLIDFLDAHPGAGVVGPQLVDQDGHIQRSFKPFPTLGRTFFDLAGLDRLRILQRFDARRKADRRLRTACTVDYVVGACMMVRRAAMQRVGLLDERFFVYHEDADWCQRFWSAGWSVWFNPAVEVVHVGGRGTAKATASGELDLWATLWARNDVVYFGEHGGSVAAWVVQGMHVAFALWGWAKWSAFARVMRDPALEHQAALFRKRLAYARRAGDEDFARRRLRSVDRRR